MKKLIVVAALAVILGGGYFALKNNIESQIRPEVDKALTNLRAQGVEAAYADMSVNVLSRSAAFEGVSLKSPDADLTIDQIVVFASDDYEKHGRFQAIGCNLKRQDLGGALKDLKGLPEIVKADAEVDYALDQAGKSVNLKLLSLALRDLGQVDLSLSLSDIPMDAARQSPLALLFAYPEIIVHAASFKYQDAGLFDLILQKTAEDEGKTPEKLIAEADASIDEQLAQAKNDPFAEEFLKALKTFLKDRKGLEVTVMPQAPVKIADIMRNKDPKAAVKALNMQAKSL
jgi:hypothetical protein